MLAPLKDGSYKLKQESRGTRHLGKRTFPVQWKLFNVLTFSYV